ncbi:MAG: nitrate reductase molybdenum cofactor assembly chaperone [Chloroflexi bacterium]|nr:nitrate reductase molybdenum cofactor assembly chaperone [Chloroflexota bacterium]
MAQEASEGRVMGLFAKMLGYPEPGLPEVVRECEALLLPGSEEATALLSRFRRFVEGTPLGRQEEIYTGTFELDPACYPYVGYHLFGETYKRSVFLLELKERYRAQGFVIENELPDHLAVLLWFLATTEDAVLAREIIHEALLPALERMMGKAKSAGYEDGPVEPKESPRRDHPYSGVLEALQLVLQRLPAPTATMGAEP